MAAALAPLLTRINQDFDPAIFLTADGIITPIRIFVRCDWTSFTITFDRRRDRYEVSLHQPVLDSFGAGFTELLIIGERADAVSVAVDFNRMWLEAVDNGT